MQTQLEDLYTFYFFILPLRCRESPPFPETKKTPPVGLEPTTLRLKAARSTD